MALGDIDVALGIEADHQRLPQIALPLGFVPIAAVAAHADGHQHLAVGTDLLGGGAGRVGDPKIVLGIDGDAMRLGMMGDHVIADGEQQLALGVPLEQLRPSDGIALQAPEIVLGIGGDGDHAVAFALGRGKRIGEGVAHGLLPLHGLHAQAVAAPVRRRIADRRFEAIGRAQGVLQRWRLRRRSPIPCIARTAWRHSATGNSARPSRWGGCNISRCRSRNRPCRHRAWASPWSGSSPTCLAGTRRASRSRPGPRMRRRWFARMRWSP